MSAIPALCAGRLLLVAPLAELSPGRFRNGGIALLGLLVASYAVAVVVLRAAVRRVRVVADPRRPLDPELAEQMGHSPAMTLNTYAHVIRELKGSRRCPPRRRFRRLAGN